MKIASDDPTEAGTHTVTVKYTLVDYPAVFKEFDLPVNLCTMKSVTPASDQKHTVAETEIVIFEKMII